MTAMATAAAAANPWMAHPVRIRDVKQEVPGVATYDLAFEDAGVAEAYRFAPGQFNMLYLPGFGESAVSVSSDPLHHDTLWHTVRVAGNVTQGLSQKAPGDQIALRGPFGSAWPMDACHGCDVVIACGGIGLAPLRPAICHIVRHRDEFGRVFLIYGARTPNDLLYSYQYDAWRDAGIEVAVTVDIGHPDWRGQIGVVPVLFDRLPLHAERTRVLTCGPEIMMRFVIFEALSRNVRAAHIYMAMERNMKCAIGFCGHCQLGPAFVCKDGPVFTYGEMEPYLHVEDL